MKSMHCLLSGKVQGVSFRFWTRDQAKSLGITGWVRNLHDGRVEVLAQGDDETLAEFKTRLLQGPPMSSVKNAECKTIDDDQSYSAFEIV